VPTPSAAETAPPPTAADTRATTDAAQTDTSTLNAVVVTGLRGGPPRTVAQSPAPIDVISSDVLEKTGRAELGEALAKVLPSFNFGTNEGGITSIVRPVSNRGLGPGYTLVLVNGKRRHNGAMLTNGGGDTSGVNPVDLDMIPTSAIDYVEVLKDSAAAQYGSDAVAGVINIVLKKGAEGGTVALTGGRLYQGKGQKSSAKAEADAGFHLGKGGFLHVSGDTRYRGMVWNNFPATQAPYAPANNPKNATWNGDGAHNGDPQIEAFNLSYNIEYPIGDVTLYSFGTGGGRWTEIGNNFRRPNSLADFSALYPDGYFPLNNTAEYDLQFVAGARGKLSGAQFDLSSSYGRDNVHQYSNFAINPSLGPTTPTSFPDLATYRFEQWVQNLDLTKAVDVGLARDLQVSGGLEYRIDKFSTFSGDPRGSQNGGYIFQAGDQEGDPNVGKPAAVGAQAGVALRPSDQARLTRSVFAGYLDLGVSPTKNWYNGLAVRAEHYDDSSGNTFGGKFNPRVDVLPQLAFRGTIGSGFRAPSLSQIGYGETNSRTNTNPITGEVSPSLTVLASNHSTLARSLGAQDLKPEKSTNLGFGTVIRPLEHLNVTIDAYQINISDRIGKTTALLGPAIAPALAAEGLPATTYVQYFANQASTRTRGIDIVGEWSHRFGAYGSLALTGGFNYNKTTITKLNPTPAGLAALPADPTSNLVFFGRAAQGDMTVNQPYTKLILGAKWHVGPVRLSVTDTRYGSYDYIRSQLPAQDLKFGAKWLTDVDVTVSVTSAFDVSLGAVNVFNVYPDKNGPIDPATGSSGLVYGPAPFAPTGGFYYTKLAYNF
jgi:iron complex outermembrane receptor protein